MAARISVFDDVPKSTGTENYSDDVVGRLHGGYLNGRTPVSLDQWRITSDDPTVADKVAELFGGTPQAIDGSKEGSVLHEVFTEAASINVILEDPDAIGTEFVLWGRDGKIAMRGDGYTLDDGTADPDAELPIQERKERAKKGLGTAPETTVYFRLADDPDLGIFKFIQRGAWNLERNLARDGFYDKLDNSDGPVLVELKREPVSFVAKQGPRAGQTVSFTQTELKFKGSAE